MTVHQVLAALHAHRWRQRMRVGDLGVLEHPHRPRVYIYLAGKPSVRLRKAISKAILARAGIDGGAP